MFVDLTGHPKWMAQYRIQEERNTPVSLITFHAYLLFVFR